MAKLPKLVCDAGANVTRICLDHEVIVNSCLCGETAGFQ